MCTGNRNASEDVACAGGGVLVANAGATVGSDQDSCCMCPAGTTTAYADEKLAFRFRPNSITRAPDGSLLWPAAVDVVLVVADGEIVEE